MAYLPLLPVQVQRDLDLDWGNLLDRFGFTGKHLEWHDNVRRDPSTQVGSRQTLDLAKERFPQVAKEYLLFWKAQGEMCGDLSSDVFANWLEEIQKQVENEVAVLWFDSSTFDPGWRAEWYKRVCKKNVTDWLSMVARGWRMAARETEKEWHKKQHQRHSLYADYASKLEQWRQQPTSDAISMQSHAPVPSLVIPPIPMVNENESKWSVGKTPGPENCNESQSVPNPTVPTTMQDDESINDPVAVERSALIQAYKSECWKRGVKVTNEMIARAASDSWHDRTPVQRWKRNDSRCTPADDVKIRAILKKRPHLQ